MLEFNPPPGGTPRTSSAKKRTIRKIQPWTKEEVCRVRATVQFSKNRLRHPKTVKRHPITVRKRALMRTRTHI